MVRAKFKCNEVTKRLSWDTSGRFLYTAKLSAVTLGSEENKAFFEATPSADISLSSYKEDHFTPGKEYFVDFTPAN